MELWEFFTDSPCSVLTSLWKEIPGGESRGREQWGHHRLPCLMSTLVLSPEAVLTQLSRSLEQEWQHQKPRWGQGMASVQGG